MVPGRDALPALRSALRRRTGIDPRALAVFRMAVGCLLVVDLLFRARYLRAFYTDGGALPRSAAVDLYPALAPLSLHSLSGAAWFQATLFTIAAVFAGLLVVGYRTQVVAAVSVVLLASLQFRNYVVLNGGDTVLLVGLFIGLLLPLGERWSIDALAAWEEPRHIVSGFASAALLSQIVLVYATNAVFKLRSDVWTGGVAVRYVFELDRFTIRFGDLLAEVTPLLVAINWTWLAMLVASPLLLLATGRARTALVAIFAGAHAGMWLTMDLGLFPHVMVALLVVFLPPPVWDRVEARLAPLSETLAEVARPPLVHSGPLVPRRLRAVGRRVAPAAAATVLVVGLLWQAAAVGYVSAPSETPVDPAEHSWKLFAPNPPTTDGYFVVRGNLSSGETVDLYPHADTADEPPPDTAATYPTARWRKYLLEARRNEVVRRQFADYLCRRGVDGHDAAVERLTMAYVQESVRLDEPNTVERVELGRYDCPVGS